MWQEEQANILATIEKHKDANTNYHAQGIHLLELAQKAYSLYLQQTPTQRRRLLNFLLSNCTLDAGNLDPTYKKPFDLMAKGHSRSDWLPSLDEFRNSLMGNDTSGIIQRYSSIMV